MSFADEFISRSNTNCTEEKDLRLQFRLSISYKSLKNIEPKETTFYIEY